MLEHGESIVIRNLTKQKEYEVLYSLTECQNEIILAGWSPKGQKAKPCNS